MKVSPDRNKKVQRRDIKLVSPKVIRSPKVLKSKDHIKGTQRYLSSSCSDMVSNLIRCFDQNSTESVKLNQKNKKIDDFSLNNIKKGSVRNAFEKLMSQKGVGSPSQKGVGSPSQKGVGSPYLPSPSQKKKIKRLKTTNITSGQKRLDSWVKK